MASDYFYRFLCPEVLGKAIRHLGNLVLNWVHGTPEAPGGGGFRNVIPKLRGLIKYLGFAVTKTQTPNGVWGAGRVTRAGRRWINEIYYEDFVKNIKNAIRFYSVIVDCFSWHFIETKINYILTLFYFNFKCKFGTTFETCWKCQFYFKNRGGHIQLFYILNRRRLVVQFVQFVLFWSL